MCKNIPYWWTSEMPSSSELPIKLKRNTFISTLFCYILKNIQKSYNGILDKAYSHIQSAYPKANIHDLYYLRAFFWLSRFDKMKLIFWRESKDKELNLVFRAMNPSITMLRIKKSWDYPYNNIKPLKTMYNQPCSGKMREDDT